MSEKLHLICMKGFRAKIRCNLSISYLSKTQKNNFQFNIAHFHKRSSVVFMRGGDIQKVKR